MSGFGVAQKRALGGLDFCISTRRPLSRADLPMLALGLG